MYFRSKSTTLLSASKLQFYYPFYCQFMTKLNEFTTRHLISLEKATDWMLDGSEASTLPFDRKSGTDLWNSGPIE